MPELTIFRNITRPTLERKVDKYFDTCKQKHLPASMSGLALALNCTRKNLVDYKNTDEFGDILERAKLMCENQLEEKMIMGTPPTGIIFILKNNYGWHDKIEQDVNLTGRVSLASLFDRAAEQRKLAGTREDIVDGEIVTAELDENLFEDDDLPQELF